MERIIVSGVFTANELTGPKLDLFTNNRGLAFRVLWGFKRKIDAIGIDVDDAEQIALCGLWKAADAYDPGLGVKFSTFATLCVTRAMMRIVNDRMRERQRWKGVRFVCVSDGDVPSRDDSIATEPEWIDDIDPKYASMIRRRLAGASWDEVAKEFGYGHRDNARTSVKAAYNKLMRSDS